MLGVLFAAAALAQDGTVALTDPAAGPSDAYVIQPGDTLWDVSTRFLGDAYAWPQLWSVNEYITNPHWIYPGNRIYFRLGDALNPPSAGMDAPAEPTDAGARVAVRGEAATSENACDFPVIFDRAIDGLKVSVPGMLGDDASLGIRGKVYASEVLGQAVGEGRIVYARVDDAQDYECGAMVGVYRKVGRKVRGPRGPLGRVYRVLALGEVVRTDGDVVSVRLRDSFTEVFRGDLVGDPVPVDFELDVRRPPTDPVDATIVARLTADEQQLMYTGETVFLDRGVEDGVDVGSSLWVVERRDGSILTGPEDKRLPERVVGRVVVVRAESESATGIVVDSAREFDVGARLTTSPNGD
jgi:hypothetical protein